MSRRKPIGRTPSMADFDRGLTLDQAAKLRNCHRRTIEANIARGSIRAIHVGPAGGGMTRILPEDLKAWAGPMRQGKRPRNVLKREWDRRREWRKNAS